MGSILTPSEASSTARVQNYQVLPAEYDDLPTMAELFVLAHEDTDVTVSNIMKDCKEGEEFNFYAEAFQKIFQHEKGVKYFKVVDTTTDKIIAMTSWHIPSKKSDVDHWGAPPTGTNQVLFEDFFGNLDRVETKWFKELGGGENIYYLYFVAVALEFQGKGIGRLATKDMLARADSEGKKTLLVSTPSARHLYGKLGFKEVDNYVVDVEAHGITGDSTWRVMVKEPKH